MARVDRRSSADVDVVLSDRAKLSFNNLFTLKKRESNLVFLVSIRQLSCLGFPVPFGFSGLLSLD